MRIASDLHSMATRLFLLAGMVIIVNLLPFSSRRADAATFKAQDGLLKLANSHYEVAVSESSGAIAYILDKATGQKVSDGDDGNALWIATLAKGDPIAASAGQFSYSWDAPKTTLTLTYTGTADVTVKLVSSDGPWLKMQAEVTNHSGAVMTGFSFPNDLRFTGADVQDGLLPLMPGALIAPSFFVKGNSYINQYPGAMFADYLAIRSAVGKLALYSQKGSILQPVFLGFEHVAADSPSMKLTHRYKTWTADAGKWSSPSVVLRVGQDYPDSLLAYRADNGIDQYKSLSDKLGSAARAYFASPMYKLDLAVLKRSFVDLKSAVVDKIKIPGIVHLVALEPGGFDNNYPDFIPPDPKWGTTEQLTDFVKAIHAEGSLVVPYTNFSWWDTESATLKALPADTKIVDVIAKDKSGSMIIESYGPNAGFVMSLQHPFVKAKIAEQHQALKQTIGVDGIFEDQWGARNAPYDLNASGLTPLDPATAYFEAILQHYRDHAVNNLMTEDGVDMLAENGVGFMGTNYLWDMIGLRSATAPVTRYYPMAGMLFRDKMLFYQHDLAAQTWTKNKDMLRWNLAQGYSLSNAFFDDSVPGLNMDNPWLALVGVFQKYALANYADQLVTRFEPVSGNVWRTDFGSYEVISNWSTTDSFTAGPHTLPPGGVVTQAKDGSVTAGVFTAFNGNPLSSGDHYLVEVRSKTDIKVFQPVGPDTTIHVVLPTTATVEIAAYGYDGSLISKVSADETGADLSFNYATTVNGQAVGYYRIARQDGQAF